MVQNKHLQALTSRNFTDDYSNVNMFCSFILAYLLTEDQRYEKNRHPYVRPLCIYCTLQRCRGTEGNHKPHFGKR